MLTITDVHKQYGTTKALTDVSLTISPGSCFGLIGPNGAGKSTLLKMIATIMNDFTGTITCGNKPLHHMKHVIGYVPQDICVEQLVSARHNLAFFGRLHNITGKKLNTRIDEVLDMIGLRERGNAKVHTFSGGMKRRLNIGCALMHQPKSLIMDEPTVGIDPQSRNYIFSMIEQLKQTGCTILYASHYMEEVEQLCDEVAFIDHGEIVEAGTIDELLRTYATPSIFIKGKDLSSSDVKQFGNVREKNGGYVIDVNNPLQTMEQTIRYCMTKQIRVDRLELAQPRLEDVFFSLTGSELRDIV